MHRTYEMYFRGRDGEVRFEALTHRGSVIDVMRHVKQLLVERDAESVDVHEAGEPLFTLMAPGG